MAAARCRLVACGWLLPGGCWLVAVGYGCRPLPGGRCLRQAAASNQKVAATRQQSLENSRSQQPAGSRHIEASHHLAIPDSRHWQVVSSWQTTLPCSSH